MSPTKKFKIAKPKIGLLGASLDQERLSLVAAIVTHHDAFKNRSLDVRETVATNILQGFKEIDARQQTADLLGKLKPDRASPK